MRCGGSDLTFPSETAPADLALVDGNNQNGMAGQPLTNPIVVKVTDRRGQPELVRVSGNGQSARPGAELPDPLVVRLVDGKGNGVPGRPVSWVIGAGGGHVESPNSNTDGDGEARTRWTLGSSGTNPLNAVVSGVGVVAFSATATNGVGGGGGGQQPARLDFRVQPSNSKEKKTVSPPVEVQVLDRDGNRVTSRAIEVKLDLVGDRDGRLKGNTRQRTGSGVARFTDLKVEREGNYRLRASAGGLPSVDSDRFEVQHH